MREGPANWIWMTEAGARGWWAAGHPGRTHLLLSSSHRLGAAPGTASSVLLHLIPGSSSLAGITTHGQGLANWVSQDPGHYGVRVKLHMILTIRRHEPTDHPWLGLGRIQRLVAGIGCLGVCQRCPHTLTGCGRASLPRTVRGSTCRGAQPNVNQHLGRGAKRDIYSDLPSCDTTREPKPVTINITMFVQKSFNNLCVLLFQGHFPTKQSQCSDFRVSTSLHYEGGLHWDLKTWYLPYNKWWQPLRCD